ncbi:MAG: hypothetical protein CM15mV26_0490 [uncultured marine virus]|nr:MAG: hypothetical protein CM15mV26_0490 [uncultured marine virus]
MNLDEIQEMWQKILSLTLITYMMNHLEYLKNSKYYTLYNTFTLLRGIKFLRVKLERV